MKKITTILKIISAVYWLIYIIAVFIKWEFYNPFWWVLEIDKNIEIRITFLSVLFIICIYGFIAISIFLDKNGKFKK